MSTSKSEREPAYDRNGSPVTGVVHKEEEEPPTEANRQMRKKTLERVNRVAEKVRSISFPKR